MASSAGTKVTKDPESTQHPTTEGPGFVASDSLAAESLRADPSRGFAADNPSYTQPSAQAAHGATAATTDTSGATTLAPARDAEQRGGGFEARAFAEVNDASRGLGKSAGRGPTWNTDNSGGGGGGFGGASGSPGGGGGGDELSTTTTSTTAGAGAGAGAGAPAAASSTPTAPGYVTANTVAMHGSDRPKGANLTEVASFEGGEPPNASFEADIGGDRDPARLAENRFVAGNERSVGAAGGGGGGGGGVEGGNLYERVGEEQV